MGGGMYLCYVDESGTPEVPGVSRHFVLAGISIPVWHWQTADQEIGAILAKYRLADAEIHTGWLMHWYREQDRIPNFAQMDYVVRAAAVNRERASYPGLCAAGWRM